MSTRLSIPGDTAARWPVGPAAGSGSAIERARGVELDERSTRLLLAGLLGLALLLRVLLLGEFPDIEADEGLWTRSSKNRVLFGDWFMDGHTHVFLSPLFHALSVVLFQVVGPSFTAARLLSAGAGVASVWLSYVLVRRLTDRGDLALVAAALFTVSELAVMLSRKALIEPLQVSLLLGSAVLLARPGRRSAAAAGLVFGLAMLTKINSVFFLAPLAVLCTPWTAGAPTWRNALQRIAIVGVVALIVSGAVYAGMYAMQPAAFRAAFVYELDGVHFEGLADPIVRIGRFGLDPVQAGRSVLALLREEPFLVVLASIGLVVGVMTRARGTWFFGAWLAVGLIYLLGQMFQPLRYFFLVFPPIVFFAALALVSVRFEGASARRGARRIAAVLVAVVVAFEIAYLAMNAAANYGRRLAPVEQWVRDELGPDERIMASALVCTELPQRCYAHYRLVAAADELDDAIRTHDIDVVIVDAFEWNEAYRNAIAERYALTRTWAEAAAYRVSPRGDP